LTRFANFSDINPLCVPSVISLAFADSDIIPGSRSAGIFQPLCSREIDVLESRAYRTSRSPASDIPLGNNCVLSVIIPAYNETEYLPRTVCAIRQSAIDCEHSGLGNVEIIVVDDCSSDDTALIAHRLADCVIHGAGEGIGQARNRGAGIARGSILVFIDADTLIDRGVLSAICESWRSGVLAGGVSAIYRTDRWSVQLLLAFWRWYAARKEMTQGVCQFFDRTLFNELHGYEPGLYMAEDTDLYERAKSLLTARSAQTSWRLLREVNVHPSMRRYNIWSSWKIIFWTNPLITRCVRSSRWFWRHWYVDPPR
jgi:glycosyltransferase involved in cell wall biosynthesis